MDKLRLLLPICVVDTALDDTAAMTMSADDDTVGGHCIDDELYVLVVEAVQTLLNDVVAVEVLDHADDMVAKSNGDSVDL